MRLFLTGASGFTGQYVQQHLRSQGWNVWACRAVLNDALGLRHELLAAEPTHVLHLAAVAFVAHGNISEMYDTNLLGTRHLLEALKQMHGLERIVLASSANVYGNSPASPLKESDWPAPANDYAVSKLAMEYLAQLYAAQLPIVIARPFNYTGPGQNGSFLIPKLIHAFARRDAVIELGNLATYREFNDVRLLCSAYELLLSHADCGSVLNICTGKMWALREVFQMLVQQTSHEPEIRVNPVFVRANEVLRLCGDPSLLRGLAQKHGFRLPDYELSQTLAWMLGKPD
jgi:GDP-6-deoxy-D-talose 4-dehydrogenase